VEIVSVPLSKWEEEIGGHYQLPRGNSLKFEPSIYSYQPTAKMSLTRSPSIPKSQSSIQSAGRVSAYEPSISTSHGAQAVKQRSYIPAKKRQAVSDVELKAELRGMLAAADLEITTREDIRTRLSDRFKLNLDDKADLINSYIDEILS
jgi:DEK C terminal domain